eukprot:601379-Pyramimonas_sp.AAC.1
MSEPRLTAVNRCVILPASGKAVKWLENTRCANRNDLYATPSTIAPPCRQKPRQCELPRSFLEPGYPSALHAS